MCLLQSLRMPYHELFTGKIASIVGAKEKEVAVTHSLTTNLHLLMVSFYRATIKEINNM